MLPTCDGSRCIGADPSIQQSPQTYNYLMQLSTVLLVTLVSHTLLTAGVFIHGRRTDRDSGYWPVMTLCLGLLGVAGYLFTR